MQSGGSFALGLKVKTPRGRSNVGEKLRAREMAGDTIDQLTDTTAAPDDQTERKQRLLKGAEEFQGVRVDRPNKR
ncbi:hypothetical protein [Bradyrhizobium sp. CB3481]|uniref:hypothetical protein n=1 Tax=Bradyrhizobium sp. CB3481 TaxID=3039158 RepID=UPI0024B11496|nr:hypothetical protein [Bradyrhizobium sp. CB3481]WFU14384.1 hypothetical protein QA643_24675 [Bradyrhizobium sp. CB3481]